MSRISTHPWDMHGTPGILENSGDSVPLAAHIQYYCFAVSDFLVLKKPVSSLNRFALLFAVLLSTFQGMPRLLPTLPGLSAT